MKDAAIKLLKDLKGKTLRDPSINPKKNKGARRRRPWVTLEFENEHGSHYRRSDGSVVTRVTYITKEEKQFCRVVNKMFAGLGI